MCKKRWSGSIDRFQPSYGLEFADSFSLDLPRIKMQWVDQVNRTAMRTFVIGDIDAPCLITNHVGNNRLRPIMTSFAQMNVRVGSLIYYFFCYLAWWSNINPRPLLQGGRPAILNISSICTPIIATPLTWGAIIIIKINIKLKYYV